MITVEQKGKTTTFASIEAALEAGASQASVDAALVAERGVQIAKECRRRIYALASAETQMNMSAAAAVISSKTASARTEQEKSVLAGLEAAIGWVAAMRGNVATLAANPDADFLADESWPAAPDVAQAVADQF